MEAPTGGRSGKAIDDAIDAFERDKCVKRGSSFYCRKCKSLIMQTTLYVSVHEKALPGCAGSGRVERRVLPYCPKCEGKPKNDCTCVHV